MRKILLIIAISLLTIPIFSQGGTGWVQSRVKNQFRDSVYFHKDANFNGTIRLGGVVITPDGTEINILNGLLSNTTELNRLVGVTANVQTQINGKVGVADTASMLSKYPRKLNSDLTGVPTAPTAASGTNTTQIATTAFVNTSFRDSMNARLAKANDITDYVWLKSDPEIVTETELASAIGSGSVMRFFELRGVVGTTVGFAGNGDSLIRNSYFNDYKHIVLERDGVVQWENKGVTNNTGTLTDVFCLVDTVLKVRPVFSTGEKVKITASASAYYTELSPQGGSGSGETPGTSPLLDSLLCYYKLDEIIGTAATDQVGGYNGVIDGTINQTGKLGKAVLFDGVYDDISIPNNAAIIPTGNTMSVSMWVNFSSLPTTLTHSSTLFALNNTSSPWTTHEIYVSETNAWGITMVNTSGTEYLCVYATPPTTGTWYHVVAVLKATGIIELWLNGTRVQTSTIAFTGNLYNAAGDYSLGNRSPNGSEGFHGLMDEPHIYNQALSPADIALLYNAGVGRTYPFN